MEKITTICYTCRREIQDDTSWTEIRNHYGYPIIVCEECQKQNSESFLYSETSKPLNCSWTQN